MTWKLPLSLVLLVSAFHSTRTVGATPYQEPAESESRESSVDRNITKSAPGFGTITGTIVIDNADAKAIPKPRTLFAVGKAVVDSRCCAAQEPILDDSLLIDPKGRGLKNVFVYLMKSPKGGRDRAASQSAWPTADPEGKTLVLGRENCTYKPHAMIITAGVGFQIQSQDPIIHSYRGIPLRNLPFNMTLPPGTKDNPASLEVNAFRRPEKYPVPVTDAVHSWMLAYQLPLDHPYAAVTDAEGRFAISDLPPGTHGFTIWHEKGGVLFDAYTVEVSADKTTDLGEIPVRLERLKKKQR